MKLSALLALAVAQSATAASYKYVVAFSVDGLHGSDIQKYLNVRPKSTFASLLETGYEYTNAFTSAVSLCASPPMSTSLLTHTKALRFVPRRCSPIYRSESSDHRCLVR